MHSPTKEQSEDTLDKLTRAFKKIFGYQDTTLQLIPVDAGTERVEYDSSKNKLS